jgi:hypothetical protein
MEHFAKEDFNDFDIVSQSVMEHFAKEDFKNSDL